MFLTKKSFYLVLVLLFSNQLFACDWINDIYRDEMERHTILFCAGQKKPSLCQRSFRVINLDTKGQLLYLGLYEYEPVDKIIMPLFDKSCYVPLRKILFNRSGKLEVNADDFKDKAAKDNTLGLFKVAISEWRDKGVTDYKLKLKNVKPSNLNLTTEDITTHGLDFLPGDHCTIVQPREIK